MGNTLDAAELQLSAAVPMVGNSGKYSSEHLESSSSPSQQSQVSYYMYYHQ